MTALTEYLKQRIIQLEKEIDSNSGDLESLKKELARVQKMEMEEDMREFPNQLLQE